MALRFEKQKQKRSYEGDQVKEKVALRGGVLLLFILGLSLGCSDTTVNVYEGAQDESPTQSTSSLGHYSQLIPDHPSRWERLPVDQDGIIMIDYGGQIGRQYNTVTVCRYALANYNVYLKTGEERYEKEFIKQADWLIERQVITEKGFSVWHYGFDWEPKLYACKAPWVSAMAQGQALSVLLRAYELTGDKRYLHTVERALGSFEYDVEDGGVRFVDEDGSVFYLEYATQKHGRVLNGFIFSLLGLYEYYSSAENQEALSLFNQGIETLNARLEDYDTGDWTLYDLLGTRSPEFYHRLHCRLLYELYFIIGDPLFLDYAEKWYSYLD